MHRILPEDSAGLRTSAMGLLAKAGTTWWISSMNRYTSVSDFGRIHHLVDVVLERAVEGRARQELGYPDLEDTRVLEPFGHASRP